jgi:phosphoribosyl 1,2-cyclic phosphodiesterase
MSRFCPLFSSSKGNAIYLSGGGASLLVDVGVSLRQLTLALAAHDLTPGELSGVLITHEHSDHIGGLAVLLKKHRLPLFASRGTLDYLAAKDVIPAHTPVIEITAPTEIDGIEVTPFQTPHDAADSLGYRFNMPDGRRIAIATDLGHVTDAVREHITGCDLVMLESNYDLRMLECSSYPWPLKRRIKGDHGHLENERCADECLRLVGSGTTRLVLGHLSEQNNMPELARETTRGALEAAGVAERLDYILHVAPPRGESPMIVL